MTNETTRSITVHSIAETETLGKRLAELLPDGSVVALTGTLGAGKTRFVQAFAEASGVSPGTVASPTFVLLHEYDGDRPIYHFDAYRLSTAEEFRRLGPDDYFEGTGVSFVEWADKFPDVLPRERLEIRIIVQNNETRRFVLSAVGSKYEPIIAQLARAFARGDISY